tara:strand:- start:497 stop:706 length:210 start_codon:yes stop_codon:yes gene_type:complete
MNPTYTTIEQGAKTAPTPVARVFGSSGFTGVFFGYAFVGEGYSTPANEACYSTPKCFGPGSERFQTIPG